ncbi:MAG TPA: hypothetical protein VE645_04495 [Pseudonocardiaceae bacterium]|jgi:hypothetical protein|nr:hypothetical protein [Pseudonocardiaceae bacterium]
MSDTANFAEFDEQHVELLPARTVLSMFSAGDGGVGSDGSDGVGSFGMKILGMEIPPGGGNGIGSAGESANG